MIIALKAWLPALLVFGVLDGLWLGLIARNFYMTQLGELRRDPFFLPPAIAFYLIYPLGLAILAIAPALEVGHGWGRAALMGAVFGLVAYATYDLSNWATLKAWPGLMSVVDIAWGAVLSAATAGAAAFIVGKWFS